MFPKTVLKLGLLQLMPFQLDIMLMLCEKQYGDVQTDKNNNFACMADF